MTALHRRQAVLESALVAPKRVQGGVADNLVTVERNGCKAAPATLLPCIGNGENVPTKRSRRMLPELLSPERPQFATGQPIEAMTIGRGVAATMVYPAVFRWQRRR